MIRTSLAVLLSLALISCASPSPAGSTKANGNHRYHNVSELRPASSELTLGIGDKISVSVYQLSELSLDSTQIRPDGLISIPMVGEVKIDGLTIPEAQDLLKEKLTKYIVDPHVIVTAESINSQKIYVIGEVSNPGTLKYYENVNVLQIISSAGGVTEDTNTAELVLVRDGKAFKLNYDQILKGDNRDNVVMASGDILYLPPTLLTSVSRTFVKIARILGPVVSVESGIVLAPQVVDAVQGNSEDKATVSISGN